MGTGLTLNKASTVIFADKAWNETDNVQAEDRAHRIGVTDSVRVISMIASGTVDERIESMLKDKAEHFAQVVEGKAVKADAKKVLLSILGIQDGSKDKDAKKAEQKKLQRHRWGMRHERDTPERV